MDNITQMLPVIAHAHTFWRLLCAEFVEIEAHRRALRFVSGDYPGCIAERLDRLLLEATARGIYSSQPGTSALIRKWRHRFHDNGLLTPAAAGTFLGDVLNSLELMDKLFASHNLSAVTVMEAGTDIDAVTHRPAGTLSGCSLNLTLRGCGHYSCIRQELLAGPGELVLLSPGAMYHYHRAERASLWEHVWIYFQPEERLLKWMNWAEVGPHIYHLSLSESDYPTIRDLFLSTLAFDPSLGGQSEALLLNITEQIFLRCSSFSSGTGHGGIDARIVQAMDFISANLDQPLSVEDIALQVQLSGSRLSTLFRTNTGRTIINWREERRVLRASHMLARESLQVQEIARRVGYDDPLYFSRVFTRLVGCSPRQYRRQHRLDVSLPEPG